MSLSKGLQLAVAVGLLVLLWTIYPGVLVVSAVAIAYIVVAVAAFRWRAANGVALIFTVLALAFSVWGVYRYVDNGFDWLGGNYAGRDGVYWPAYLFLLVALGSAAVIVLQLAGRSTSSARR